MPTFGLGGQCAPIDSEKISKPSTGLITALTSKNQQQKLNNQSTKHL